MRFGLTVHLSVVLAFLGACTSQETSTSDVDDAPAVASAALNEEVAAPVDGKVAAPEPEDEAEELPGRTDGCGEGMVRVEGEYCPAVMQDCLEHHKEYEQAKDDRPVSERCLRYAKPSRCVSKQRKKLSFCMDRYEYPNEKGKIPVVLTSWLVAKATCEEAGKRLCTEDEYNFACEGPDMLPYVYGYDRDKTQCNIDQPYIYPDHSRTLPMYDACLLDPSCSAELQRLDQREPAGARKTCVSWAGIYDLNGNVNEWVVRNGDQKPPTRSGLKGGWWGPVRGRCRPTVTFHKENDYGYEVGFRCCDDVTK